MRKHAYLIMCYEYNEILCTLLRMIDCCSNDIFVHIDAKSDDFSSKLRQFVQYSNIFFVRDRIKVYWAHYSQIEAEYRLFRDAYRGGYLRYHLLSGIDLPIKSQQYIHDFCDSYPDKEFLGISDIIDNRLKRFILFPKYQRFDRTGNGSMISYFLRCMNFPFDVIQRYLHYPFGLKNYTKYKMGPNWCSLTHNSVGILLDNKDKFLSTMKRRGYTDEIWKQTIIYNELGLPSFYDLSSPFKGCMRLIDWKRGNPYSFTINDFKEIINSDRLFCRKINDVDLAHMLEKYVAAK